MNTSHTKTCLLSSLSFSCYFSYGFTVPNFVSPSCYCYCASSLPAFFIPSLPSACHHCQGLLSTILAASPSTSAIKIPALHAEKQTVRNQVNLWSSALPALYQLFRCSPPSYRLIFFCWLWWDLTSEICLWTIKVFYVPKRDFYGWFLVFIILFLISR